MANVALKYNSYEIPAYKRHRIMRTDVRVGCDEVLLPEVAHLEPEFYIRGAYSTPRFSSYSSHLSDGMGTIKMNEDIRWS